jgi:murein DD-endopeptidase MepM/ murein hydrolase activator NlpD
MGRRPASVFGPWSGELRWQLRRIRRALAMRRRLQRAARRLRHAAPQLRRLPLRLIVHGGIGALVLIGFVAAPARSWAVSASEMAGMAPGAEEFDPRPVVLPFSSPLTLERFDGTAVRRYVVQAGDTLLGIAASHGVAPETVAYNNGLRGRASLFVNDVLRIPVTDGALHVVAGGETPDAVAARFGGDLRALMDLNRLHYEPENFATGKTIVVPLRPDRLPLALAKSEYARTAAIHAVGGQPLPGRVSWPVSGYITQYFSGRHMAIDVAAPYGTGLAAEAGVVTAVGFVPVGGLRVCVRHNTGIESCYYHLSRTYVVVGERVARGKIVAAIGLTGVTTGPHVHWEATYGGIRINPLAY